MILLSGNEAVARGAWEAGVVLGTGYPGTVASMWQQMGRAGRRSGLSAAILVASSSAVDQFLMRHPEYLLGRAVESGIIDRSDVAPQVRRFRTSVRRG